MVAARNRSKLALATLGVALLLGASRAAEFPIGGGNHLHQTNTLGNLAPEMNDTIGNVTEMANDTIADDENLDFATEGEDALQGILNQGATDLGDDINVDISNVDSGNSIGRRSLLDGGIPLTVEGSDTTTSLGDEVEGLLPRLEKIPPQGLDMAPLAELEAEAPAFENAPSGVAGVDFAAGPESSTSEVPAPSGEASPAEGGVGDGMPTDPANMTMEGTMPMMNMNGTGDMATDDIMPMMNDTMMNMTMNGTDDMANGTTDASDEMANDTIAEDPEEMPATDDGRRRLY